MDSHFNPEFLPSHLTILQRPAQSSSTVELHAHGFFLEDKTCHSSRTLSFRPDSVLCLDGRNEETYSIDRDLHLHSSLLPKPATKRPIYSTDDLRIKPSNLHHYCKIRTDGILSSERCLFTTAPRIQTAFSPSAHPRGLSQQQRITRRAGSSNIQFTQRHEDLFITYQRST